MGTPDNVGERTKNYRPTKIFEYFIASKPVGQNQISKLKQYVGSVGKNGWLMHLIPLTYQVYRSSGKLQRPTSISGIMLFCFQEHSTEGGVWLMGLVLD